MTNPATETKSSMAAGRRGACPERSEGVPCLLLGTETISS